MTVTCLICGPYERACGDSNPTQCPTCGMDEQATLLRALVVAGVDVCRMGPITVREARAMLS